MKKFIKDILETILISLIIVFVLIKFILIPCKVDGSSMYPNLKDQYFGYSFVITKNISINRFDICVINLEEKKLVKRVIGLPNDEIEYKDNKLYVNGEFIEETFIDKEEVTTQDFKIKLNDNEYYCLGDNRPKSKDSRFYGPFKKEQIIATHFMCMYPFDEFGFKN